MKSSYTWKPFHPSGGHQSIDSFRNFPRDTQQRGNELFIHIHVTLILGQISFAVCLIQDAPLFIGQVNRVLQALKHQVARFRPVAAETQCRQSQRVCGVVGEIETAFEAEFFARGIIKPAKART